MIFKKVKLYDYQSMEFDDAVIVEEKRALVKRTSFSGFAISEYGVKSFDEMLEKAEVWGGYISEVPGFLPIPLKYCTQNELLGIFDFVGGQRDIFPMCLQRKVVLPGFGRLSSLGVRVPPEPFLLGYAEEEREPIGLVGVKVFKSLPDSLHLKRLNFVPVVYNAALVRDLGPEADYEIGLSTEWIIDDYMGSYDAKKIIEYIDFGLKNLLKYRGLKYCDGSIVIWSDYVVMAKLVQQIWQSGYLPEI